MIKDERINQVTNSLAGLLESKNTRYGDSVSKAEDILHLLFPNGIKTKHYVHLHLIIRILDKLSRISSDNVNAGAVIDAWNDIAGYAVLGVILTEDKVNSHD